MLLRIFNIYHEQMNDIKYNIVDIISGDTNKCTDILDLQRN